MQIVLTPQKRYKKHYRIMEFSSLDSNPILRLYYQFLLISKLEKWRLMDYIDRILVNLHFIIFKAWITKNIRLYYQIMNKNNGILPIFFSNQETNHKLVYSNDYLFIKKHMGTFMTHCFIASIGNTTNEEESNEKPKI